MDDSAAAAQVGELIESSVGRLATGAAETMPKPSQLQPYVVGTGRALAIGRHMHAVHHGELRYMDGSADAQQPDPMARLVVREQHFQSRLVHSAAKRSYASRGGKVAAAAESAGRHAARLELRTARTAS